MIVTSQNSADIASEDSLDYFRRSRTRSKEEEETPTIQLVQKMIEIQTARNDELEGHLYALRYKCSTLENSTDDVKRLTRLVEEQGMEIKQMREKLEETHNMATAACIGTLILFFTGGASMVYKGACAAGRGLILIKEATVGAGAAIVAATSSEIVGQAT